MAEQYTADLRTLITVKAWEDAKFASDLKTRPKETIQEFARSLGLDVPDVEFNVVSERKGTYTVVIAENPMGMSPAEWRRSRVGTIAHARARGTGLICSYTADCGCSDTYTGGCSCHSVAGTPCVTCVTVFTC